MQSGEEVKYTMKSSESLDVKIVPYKRIHQYDIDHMVAEIALEFDRPIFTQATNSNSILPSPYWVALSYNQVIGTVGIVECDKGFGVLKRMFLKKSFRGKGYGVSKLLLKTAINYCIENGIEQIYLGTMDQFKVAQLFYLKNGFKRISERELPTNFLKNPLDSVFFRWSLNEI